MFTGQTSYSIDDKGRVIFPQLLRSSMGLRFHITRGLGKCLFVFRKEEWDVFNQSLTAQSFLDTDALFPRFGLPAALPRAATGAAAFPSAEPLHGVR